ncbi:mitofusin-2-like [Watersipora subatra]|uniref:mitofusin-2-like n=1 Tax=Watersipora subatra TaxID=2589382 RepID=UPI00355C32C9
MSGHLRTNDMPSHITPSTPLTKTMPDRMAKSLMTAPSPLKIFGAAKKRIRDIFADIAAYVEESKDFVKDINDDRIMDGVGKSSISKYSGKVSGIRDVLARDLMKVVFFGRTSNGKSTVINSMLRSKLLPSGIGHTTHCFVQVEGTDSTEGFMLLEGSEERRPVASLKELASALSAVKLEQNALIRICWPKNKCGILKDDVVLVDSPGIDVDPDLDSWIDKFCLDADVFVLVANAESTLMQTEKNFFLKVSDKLSKPTVFILNNRWDASASEPETMEMVRSQHLERNKKFLCQQLKVVSEKEAEDRIFFVSAKEALHQRLTESGVATAPLGAVLEGYQSRLFEFANFERTFEECISRSAVKTKFAQHACKGKQMACELKDIMDSLLDRCYSIREELRKTKTLSGERLKQLERQLADIGLDIEDSIQKITDDVQLKVSRALSDELRRLHILVNEFERPFHPDPVFMNLYKKELHVHVESGLGKNVQARCSSSLDELVNITEQRMAERLLTMLPDGRHEAVSKQLASKPAFTVEYRLDARNLCADFKEDIDFKFSFSPSNLISKYIGRQVPFTAFWNQSAFQPRIPTTIPPTVEAQMDSPPPPNVFANGDLAVTLMRLAPAVSSTGTLFCISVAGLMSRYVGWKVLTVVGGIYGSLYVYERLLWSNRAKERAFKSQYVNYASSKLQLIVDMTSANASHQVQQELSGTYARLRHEVEQAKAELKTDIEEMKKDMKRFDESASKAKTLRNKAGWLENELKDFIGRYIDYA